MNFGCSGLRTPALAGVLLGVLLLLGGCAAPQITQLTHRWPADLPAQFELQHVPFYPQEDYECGPAALAMAASAAGMPVRPEQLVEQVYLPGRKGALQLEMLAAGRRQGLLAYPLAPQLEMLLREVAAGHPVVVFQNLSLPIRPLWHYAVVIGFDKTSNTLLLHSGRTPRLEMSLNTFEHTWARGHHWAMVLLPPSELPATAQAGTHASAAAALERVHPGAAGEAYTRALQAWPTQRSALLGLGNVAYGLGQPEQAIEAYRHATQVQPNFSDAWNNLAHVLLEQGRLSEAQQAIEPALKLGGPRLAAYAELAQKIKTAGEVATAATPALPR